MKTRKSVWWGAVLLALAFAVGCAGIPVRDAVKVDMKLPWARSRGANSPEAGTPSRSPPPGLAGYHPVPKIHDRSGV